jgi:hypothetical protein
MKTSTKFAPEVRERAVHLVQEHQGDARVAVGRNRVDRQHDGCTVSV